VAKRFMRAFDRSVRFTHEHPELAAADLHTMVPEVDAAVATAQIGDSMPLTFNEISEADGLGAMTPERIATTWDWVARANELSVDSLDPETIVNRDFMPVAE
jgi:NitT/TauT family transport system substrate-binding protein